MAVEGQTDPTPHVPDLGERTDEAREAATRTTKPQWRRGFAGLATIPEQLEKAGVEFIGPDRHGFVNFECEQCSDGYRSAWAHVVHGAAGCWSCGTTRVPGARSRRCGGRGRQAPGGYHSLLCQLSQMASKSHG